MDPNSENHQPYAALAYRNFRLYAVGSLCSNLGLQMMGVAVAWQIYRLTHSAMALGLVGLAEVVPIVGLMMPAGHLADRLSRRRVTLVTNLISVACALLLALLSYDEARLAGFQFLQPVNHWLEIASRHLHEHDIHITSALVPLLYGVIAVLGVVRAFAGPARAALLPSLVPARAFQNAVTWNSSFFQLTAVIGPAIGGLIMGALEATRWQFALPYGLAAAGQLVMFACIWLLPEGPPPSRGEPVSFQTLSAGIRFVGRQRIILATITLDLFAVLLGGAVALLPMYADQILHVGARGLGLLRAAPSVGALSMALVLAHRPALRRAGPTLLGAVTAFGLATIVFGLSRNFALSLVMLFATGAVDNISVVVRHTLVQLLTPDAMRGRVSAVNQVFISISNEVGALESGLTAAWFGPVLSVVGGGVGTILVVIAVCFGFPELLRFGSLAEARRVEESESGSSL
jgi:MFS family permease